MKKIIEKCANGKYGDMLMIYRKKNTYRGGSKSNDTTLRGKLKASKTAVVEREEKIQMRKKEKIMKLYVEQKIIYVMKAIRRKNKIIIIK